MRLFVIISRWGLSRFSIIIKYIINIQFINNIYIQFSILIYIYIYICPYGDADIPSYFVHCRQCNEFFCQTGPIRNVFF